MSTDVQASIYWIGQKVHLVFFHKMLQKNPYKVTFWPTQYLCIYLSTIYLSTQACVKHTYTHTTSENPVGSTFKQIPGHSLSRDLHQFPPSLPSASWFPQEPPA